MYRGGKPKLVDGEPYPYGKKALYYEDGRSIPSDESYSPPPEGVTYGAVSVFIRKTDLRGIIAKFKQFFAGDN
jgi:hypothetical protein